MILLFQLLFILTLLFISAIFSSSETAIIASSSAKLQHKKKQGHIKATQLLHLKTHMGQIISSLLIGGTFLNVISSSLATAVMIRIFGEAGVLYASGVMGIFIVMYVEVTPKVYAISNPEKVALNLAGFLNAMFKFLAPLARLSDFVAKRTLRRLGIDTTARSDSSVTEELRGLIDLHGGPFEAQQERRMLRSILDLDETRVDEIMTHRKDVFRLNVAEGALSVLHHISNSPHTRVPIWRDHPDNIVGVLHAKALLRAYEKVQEIQQINIYEVANRPWFIPHTTTLLDQLQAFKHRREHFAIVVDEYGSFLGIVTLEDILEEIVGEIVDEHDVDLPGVRLMGGDRYLIRGDVTVRDLNRQFEWELPTEEAITMAGLVIQDVQHIPEVGQVFRIHNLRIKILRRSQHQITLLEAQLMGEDSPQ